MVQNSKYSGNNKLVKFKQEMILRNFSQKTINSYLYYTNQILKYANKGPKTINASDIKKYLKKYSAEVK